MGYPDFEAMRGEEAARRRAEAEFSRALRDVRDERERQEKKWGRQDHVDIVESLRAEIERAGRAGLRQGVCRRCAATVLRGTALTDTRLVEVVLDPHLVLCVRHGHIRLPPDPRWPHVQWERMAWYATTHRRFEAVIIADRQLVMLELHEARHEDEPGALLARRSHRCGGPRV